MLPNNGSEGLHAVQGQYCYGDMICASNFYGDDKIGKVWPIEWNLETLYM